MSNTISIGCDTPTKEGKGVGAILPGHLVERTGNADEVQVHSTAAAIAQRMFALEDAWQGKDIDAAYAAGSRIFFRQFLPGDVVLARTSGAIAVGAKVESAGDGTLRTATGDNVVNVVGVALEAAANDKCKIEII